MAQRFFFMISFFIIVFPLIARNRFTDRLVDRNAVSVTSSRESTRSFISYVIINGVPYLLKQKKSAGKQFSVVRDALAAWIAKDLHIAHSVKIISSQQKFPGKKNMTMPAVLLTIAPGKTVRAQPESKYYNLALKQRKIDGMFSADRWFTETIIHQMTWHDQLPIIVALDLFICNTDRHRSNLFYDPSTDTFCAIDMDNIFRHDLPLLAMVKLKLMLDRKKQFTQAEIKALKIMRKTLQFLMDKYSVRCIINKLDFFVAQAEFAENNPKLTLYIAKKIARHKQTIRQSRLSLRKLLLLLDKII